jgi:hypothetical protein
MGSETRTSRLTLAAAVAAGVIGASFVRAVAERMRSAGAFFGDQAWDDPGPPDKRSRPNRPRKRVTKKDRSMMVETTNEALEERGRKKRRGGNHRSKGCR